MNMLTRHTVQATVVGGISKVSHLRKCSTGKKGKSRTMLNKPTKLRGISMGFATGDRDHSPKHKLHVDAILILDLDFKEDDVDCVEDGRDECKCVT